MPNEIKAIPLASNDNLMNKKAKRKPISAMATDALVTMRNHYRSAGLTRGGIYDLHEIAAELIRREAGNIDGASLAMKIAEMSLASPTGFTSYVAVHTLICPGKHFSGNRSVTLVMQALGTVIAHAAATSTPIMTTLVRRVNTGELTLNAKANIFNTARELGIAVGDCIEQFIEEETLGAWAYAAMLTRKAA